MQYFVEHIENLVLDLINVGKRNRACHPSDHYWDYYSGALSM